MNEYEDYNKATPEDPQQDNGYTDYANTPETGSEYRYVPELKKEKLPWKRILALVLCCSLLSGAIGAGGVLLVQHFQTKGTPQGQGTNVSHILLGTRENAVIENVEVETGKRMTPSICGQCPIYCWHHHIHHHKLLGLPIHLRSLRLRVYHFQ